MVKAVNRELVNRLDLTTIQSLYHFGMNMDRWWDRVATLHVHLEYRNSCEQRETIERLYLIYVRL